MFVFDSGCIQSGMAGTTESDYQLRLTVLLCQLCARALYGDTALCFKKLSSTLGSSDYSMTTENGKKIAAGCRWVKCH